jgi:hypothetical protein
MTKRKKKKKKKTTTTEVWLSDAMLLAIDRDVDRYIERWLRHVILVDHGTPRRLSAEEIQHSMKFSKAQSRRERANYRRRRERARRKRGRTS